MKKAAITRLNILQKAFELIYGKGYLTTSIDEILATTHVTKGAFYYHFKNKDEMGIAIINELLKPTFEATFLKPLASGGDPVQIIYDMMHEILMDNEFLKVEYGCPAANFTQEMAPWNTDFTKALNDLSAAWKDAIIACIENGKKDGSIHPDVKADQVAIFIMSGYWGIRNIGKLSNSKAVYLVFLKQLKDYLETLR
ncbi:AcrR family transcriptional regulator [Flavobacterium gossypii]|uniref:AcrR family transcriptional regulator n=1 Tax=Flavobacterium gossypii TaxID=1646119 RepID=A0ABR6DKY7_9FLAO|nr:TetR/AcrR family transcriptional regulator [Flavobacterium gossypii]MBA9072345.1 AcrR family transcriptional regulator [Flavobacterium gossypii]